MAGGQFPGGLDSFTANTDDVDDVLAADINELQVGIVAVETELGTDPAGSCTDVTTRLAHSINDAGWLEFDDCTELTIASGVVTATQNYHKIDTQGDATTDDLDTINGFTAGMFIVLRSVADARNVVIKHNTGNILCASAQDITLDVTSDVAFGVYDNGQSKWLLFRGASSQTLDSTGTPANSYIAVWTDANTLEGQDDLQWNGTTFTIGDGTAGRDYILTFVGADTTGVITWMEDEDYFKFGDDIHMNAQERISFDSLDTYIAANTDNPEDLVIAADQDILLQADNQVVSDTVIRAASTLYRRYYHMPITSSDPGASGATWTAPDGNTIGGWLVTDAGHVLYLGADVHADWDGVSDLTVEVKFEINDASTEDQTVDLKLVCYYKGVADTATKTQTIEVATNVGDGGVKAQYTSFHVDFTINEDLASHNVDPGDIFNFILNLETDTSEVDTIIVNSASLYYNTTHLGIEAGDV